MRVTSPPCYCASSAFRGGRRAIGVVLPALTRIKSILVPLAALGFSILQVLAIGFHIMRGEFAQMAPINLTLLGLSLFVLWGRIKKSPIAARR